VLFAADTQESSGYIKSSTTKLRTIFGKDPKKGEPWEIMVASSGDAVIVDEAIDDIFYFVSDKIKADEKKPAIALSVLRKKIGDIAYATYKKYKDREVDNPEFELLFGAADEFSTILKVTCEGKNKELDKVGMIGSGRVTGGELLLSEFLKEEPTEDEAASLAALVISTVGHVDMFVGGEPDFCICRDRAVLKYTKKFHKHILEDSESKWTLIKEIWQKMLEDSAFEKKVKRLLKK
jgi:20S proteasome alpha/beta subunit